MYGVDNLSLTAFNRKDRHFFKNLSRTNSKSTPSYGAVNSFFDHNTPNYYYDSTLLIFTGYPELQKANRWPGNDSCDLGKSCYGGHPAIDYSTPAGSPIYSAADGEILLACDFSQPYQICPASDYDAGGLGKVVVITHTLGYQTVYGHLDNISLSLDPLKS